MRAVNSILHRQLPDGGFYVWLTLPDLFNSKAMLPLAVKELVAYTPGTAFFANGDGQQNIRLSFCYPTPAQIRVGVRRLATVVRDELDLLETFAGTGSLEPARTTGRFNPLPTDVS